MTFILFALSSLAFMAPFILLEIGLISLLTALIAEGVIIVIALLIAFSTEGEISGAFIWIGIVLLAFFFVVKPYMRIHNGMDLNSLLNEEVRRGKGVNGEAHFTSGEWLSVQHKLLFLIPLYKDHYYFVFNDDMTKCIAVRANGKWAERFGESGFSEEGVPVKGYVQEFSLDMIRPSLKTVLDEHIQYWNSIGFYPEVDRVCYIEPRPFFNLNSFFDMLDAISDASD